MKLTSTIMARGASTTRVKNSSENTNSGYFAVRSLMRAGRMLLPLMISYRPTESSLRCTRRAMDTTATRTMDRAVACRMPSKLPPARFIFSTIMVGSVKMFWEKPSMAGMP